MCPDCGERDRTRWNRETLTCPCGFDDHADLATTRTLLERATDTPVRPTARPVRFQWDDHEWYPVEDATVALNE
ncbi:transposase [Haloferax sp. Atlit-48N]|uniref:Zinc ribbon domain-containing protein n=1 Tax=Haloferax sp. Atlit-48N TaxID=2077198 RepID=A0ACD5I691_9EURY|nr:transposase [Haloferax sp. Atlit-48N]